MGMSVGESKEALSRANESDDEEVKAQYQPKQVRLTVVGIEIAALPVVDDEFAKKLGVQTVDEMRSQLRKQLHLREERAYHQALRNSISAQLLTNYGTYDIPQSILLKEVEHRSKSYMASPEHRKLAMSRTKEENENFHRELLKESADAIRMFFLCKHIVDKNHIRFSFEDSANQPSNMIEAMFQGNPKPAFNTLSKEEQALQYSRKMLTAAEDFLIDRLQKS
jgi:FKBP-type peptidyl-prolyl cis-trans isomerase (trigger factor)